MATTRGTVKGETVGIIGSGLIGRSWAILFSGAGYHVRLFDAVSSQVDSALADIKDKLKSLEAAGDLRGSLTAQQQFSLISTTDSLKECLSGVKYIQECVPEDLALKKKVHSEIDAALEDENTTTVIASSTSTLPASKFSEELKHRSQVIVVHPTNPPLFCPLTEVVPAPWTDPSAAETAMSIMKEIGQVPVLLKKELKGFVLNRLQYSILAEAWRLVQDGVVSPSDVDTVMSAGLGTRYAFVGPLETCHLNAEGFLNYCERYGKTIYDVSRDFGPVPQWDADSTKEVITDDLERRVPLNTLTERRKWRDSQLNELSRLKKIMDAKK